MVGVRLGRIRVGVKVGRVNGWCDGGKGKWFVCRVRSERGVAKSPQAR